MPLHEKDIYYFVDVTLAHLNKITGNEITLRDPTDESENAPGAHGSALDRVGAFQEGFDGDAATWLPPHKAYRCEYVARQVAVKLKYDAWMTQAEHDAVQKILQTCPKQKLPADEKIAPLSRSEGESIGDKGSD